MIPDLARYRKFLVAAAGVLAQLVALGVLNGQALHYAQVILSALAAVGVLATPNSTPPADPQPPHQPEHAA